MRIDKELVFNAVTAGVLVPQAVTLVTDNISDNVVDLGRNYPRALDNLYFVLQCDAVPVSAGGGTLTVSLVTSAAVGLTTPQTLWSSGLLANATIVAYTADSTLYHIPVPPYALLRYLGVIYTITVAVWTAGSFRAFITPDAPHYIPATP
jgi:hypothetical protein